MRSVVRNTDTNTISVFMKLTSLEETKRNPISDDTSKVMLKCEMSYGTYKGQRTRTGRNTEETTFWGSFLHEGLSVKSTYSIILRKPQIKINRTQRVIHSIGIRTANPWWWVLKVFPLKMPSGTLGWKDFFRPRWQQKKSMSNHFFLHYASTLQRFTLTETRSKFCSVLVFKFFPLKVILL